MAATDQEPGNTQSVSAEALRQMSAHGVAPTPQNYFVWYLYSAGSNPGLDEAIGMVLKKGAAFTEPLCQTLFESFCVGEQARQLVARKSGALGVSVGEILANLDAVGSSVASYNQSLGAFETAVTGAKGDSKSAVARLLAETKRVRQENAQLQSKLVKATTDMADMKSALDGAAKETRTDALTQVGNRRAFEESMGKALRIARETGGPMVLVMIDIDHFKRFNDIHGHQVGDDVLKVVAKTLSECVKGRDMVARYGGEEFALILPATNLGSGVIVAEQVRSAAKAKRIAVRGTTEEVGGVTISLGVAELAPSEAAESLIARADAALYEAKRSGRDRVCAAGTQMPQHAKARTAKPQPEPAVS